MCLRSARERAVQTLCYEAVGLVLITPLCALLSGVSLHGSGVLLAVLAVLVMLWAALYNTIFDWMELRLSGRVASDRRRFWRCIHAIALEISACIVTLPVTMIITGLPLGRALWLELWLTAIYAAYALLFFAVYDRLRPVMPVNASGPRRTSRPEATLQ